MSLRVLPTRIVDCERGRAERSVPPTWRDDGGAVMMEYVVALVLVACLLLVALNESFYDWTTQTFGSAGQAVKLFYQRLLGGLSLPIP